MKVIVCGGRNERDGDWVHRKLKELDATIGPIDLIIEGGQRKFDPWLKQTVGGVDYHAFTWAKRWSIPYSTMIAGWSKFGDRAGPIRNAEMLKRLRDIGEDIAVIAFPGGPGTANMVKQARRSGVSVIEVSDDRHRSSVAEHQEARRPGGVAGADC